MHFDGQKEVREEKAEGNVAITYWVIGSLVLTEHQNIEKTDYDGPNRSEIWTRELLLIQRNSYLLNYVVDRSVF